MDYSSANIGLWGVIIQFGVIGGILLLSNAIRRKAAFVRKSLMPVAVLGGFLLLALRVTGVLPIERKLLEMITYHGIALGFIAMSMRIPNKADAAANSMAGPKSGALIAGSYVIQGILGLAISLLLAYTIMPGLFKASGILLPMGYGQGPGQANNVGTTYESLGFMGGRSFALSIAAAGYLSACIVGILYINIMSRKGKLSRQHASILSGSATVDTFQDQGEMDVSASVDKLSVQIAMILVVYLATFLIIDGLTRVIGLFGPEIGKTVGNILWGFNFIIGSVVAILTRVMLNKLKKAKIMTQQYQNNYLLSRIAGLAFDLMIVCGIASIEFADLKGLWLPFLLMAVLGAIVTLLYLSWICKKVYPGYYYEGMLSMYGMMTGTISSGVLLLRELDPGFTTPAANNLVVGSSFAIIFGAPMLALIGLAPSSDVSVFVTLGILVVYFVLLVLFMTKANRRAGKAEAAQAREYDQVG